MSFQTLYINEKAQKILSSIPSNVTLVAAAKGRSIAQVEAAINAGITHIGHNYIQEALPMIESLGERATWHMIGHLQRNKVKRAIGHFDIIETVDSLPLAEALERSCAAINKIMPVFVEVNSGREANKTGVLPENIDKFILSMTHFQHIRVQGLMTMGPRFGNPEEARPYFKATRAAFERISKNNFPNISMEYLSMGMSNSYFVAIEEGANIVRIGTKIFSEH